MRPWNYFTMKLRLLALSTAPFITLPMPAADYSAMLPKLEAVIRAEMWKPQLTPDAAGFGLGFLVGKFREHRSISHSGAVYGHSTSRVVRPDAKLAVIILANEDIVNARVANISNTALSLILEAKVGESLAASPAPFPFERDDAGKISGFTLGPQKYTRAPDDPPRCRRSGAPTSAATGRTLSRSWSANATGSPTR